MPQKKTTSPRHVLFRKARVSATPVVLQQTCRRRPPDLNHGRPVLRAPPEGSEKNAGNCHKIMTKGHCEKWLDIGIAWNCIIYLQKSGVFSFKNQVTSPTSTKPKFGEISFFSCWNLISLLPYNSTLFCLRIPIFCPNKKWPEIAREWSFHAKVPVVPPLTSPRFAPATINEKQPNIWKATQKETSQPKSPVENKNRLRMEDNVVDHLFKTSICRTVMIESFFCKHNFKHPRDV